MSSVSVLTLARGRQGNLANLVAGLACQTTPPAELVIAAMQATPFDGLPPTQFPIHQILVPGQDLPLAAARNAAARKASADRLVFIDTDCIPGPTLVADYGAALDMFDGLVMGEVLYLPEHATAGGLDFAGFAATGVKHSDRMGRPGKPIMVCDDYRCFWSLNFALSRRDFDRAGGFDERYVGYGGEDTDFGKQLGTLGIPIAWTQGAVAYHQYHPHHMPPVHHLDSVVRNSELFQAKWGYRTMGHWLAAFELMGLLENAPYKPLRVLRRPQEQDFAMTLQHGHQPYSNTASVIRTLQQRATNALATASCA